ncbi:MAG: hypothetical protein ACK56I_26620 [bacterium]
MRGAAEPVRPKAHASGTGERADWRSRPSSAKPPLRASHPGGISAATPKHARPPDDHLRRPRERFRSEIRP